MATPNEQLREIYQDLQNKFGNNKYIRVIPFDDDPPEKYEVKYSILGLAQDSDGKVVESREHSIFINIPFGFPHFPPSCTPQTPTFHPDFDQAAICIGEFWNKDRTLPELILHIGKMISGEIYSTENAFNDSAVAWYQKIAHQIPFEDIELSYDDDEAEPEVFDLSEDDLVPHSIDTLGDEDIASKHDYLSTGKMDVPEDEISFPHTAQPSGKSSVNRIHLLIRQKRYYELSVFLNDLPEEEQFEDREEIETNITNLLNKAKKLQKEADEFEHQGDPKMALELFEKVASIVPDFPNIQENIDRTRNSVELSDDWDAETEELAEAIEETKPTTTGKRRVAFFEETTKATIRLLPILGVILVIVLAVIFIMPYFSAKSNLEKATQMYSQCTRFMEMGQFTRAQGQCDDAQNALKKISLYKKKDRDALQRQIKLTLTSEEMEQGLAGRVFFQGKFVKKTDMDRVLKFNKQKEEADGFFTKSSWKKAADYYNEALKTAQPILDSFEETLLQEVKDRINISEINLSINRGFSLLSRGELEKSQEMFTSALTAAEALPEEYGGSLISRITPKLKEIQYLQHLDLGKKYFDANDWEGAIKQYEKALQLRDLSSVSAEHVDAKSLYGNMAEAELYAFINKAKDAFSKAEMDQAIEEYQKAIDLLDTNKELLERINPDEIKQQLERIILRTRIVQFKQEADAKLEKNSYQDAISALEQVIASVTASGFQEDKEFKAIIQGTRKTIADTKSKAAIAKRIKYLEKNFKELFEKNYSAAVPEYLSEPKATFLKFENNKELYELQCLERRQGRKLRLVMLYSFDPAQNKWQFYSESQ